MGNNTEYLQNGLRLSIDWIRFTVTEPMTVIQVIEFMGFSVGLFRDMPKGADGYRSQKKYDNISVLYDGKEDMGIHVNIAGSAVPLLMNAFKEKFKIDTPFGDGYDMLETVLSVFCTEVLEIGHFTRLDIAVDDLGGNYYTPDEIYNLYHEGKIVSKFRSAKRIEEARSPRTCTGYTVYFGSRTSMIMLRIYDKKLEQNKGLTPEDDGYINMDWIRWELEIKDSRANELAEELARNHTLAHVGIGVLTYYFRIIQHDDTNRSRCSNEERWNLFICGIEKLRLTLPQAPKTINQKKEWLEHQAAPTLALMVLAYDGDTSYLHDMVLKNVHRISQRDRELLREYNPEAYKHYCCDEDDV